MGLFTTRLALRKPAGGSTGTIPGDDLVDVDDLNFNADKIDAAIGLRLCTSTTRPSTPFDGQPIYETDTKNQMFWSQSASRWIPVGVPNAGSDAIRNTLYPAPVDGDRVYRTDLDFEQKHNGTKWLFSGAGLVPVVPTAVTGAGSTVDAKGLVTLTAATDCLIQGVFTSDYRDYRVIIDMEGRTAAVDAFLRWLVGAVEQSTANYGRRGGGVTTTSNTLNEAVNNGTSMQLDNGGVATTSATQVVLEISRPAEVKPLVGNGQSASFQNGSNGWSYFFGFVYAVNIAIDGFRVFPATAAGLTGTVQVLGYTK